MDNNQDDVEERVNKSLVYYFQQIDLPLLSEEEEKRLSYRCLNGDSEARNMLIERNLRLVVSIAKKYIGSGLSFMDLIQEGNIGLMKAASKYDASKGYRFSSYAVWDINSSIQYAIFNQNRIIKIPVYVQKKINKLNKEYVKLQTILKRVPTKEEVIDYLNITSSEYNDYMFLNKDVISMQEVIDHDSDETLENFLSLNIVDISEIAISNVVRDEYIKLFRQAKLSNREIDFLLMRYGFYDGNVYTLEEIGDKYNISRQAVYQFLKEVLNKLREFGEIKKYRFFSNSSKKKACTKTKK